MQQISWSDFLIVFFSGAVLSAFLFIHAFAHPMKDHGSGGHMPSPITTEL